MSGPITAATTTGEVVQRLAGDGRPVQYIGVKVRTLLRQAAEEHGPWHWVVNPYDGCEFACTHCPSRMDVKEAADWRSFEQRIRVRTNSVEAFIHDIHAPDFEKRQVVLGSGGDPWQQAEEHFRVTRALLQAMSQVHSIDLRISTRSSLIARDTDVLRTIGKKGRVTVAFSIPSMDERINRLMEPRAPSAFRRLAAMEALARAGISVGLMVSPVMVGLDEEELGLETMITRAANAGARFAGMNLLTFAPGQRESWLAQVTAAYPEAGTRFRRVIGRRAPTEDERATLFAHFDLLCQKHGLLPIHDAVAVRNEPRRETAEQLQLFELNS